MKEAHCFVAFVHLTQLVVNLKLQLEKCLSVGPRLICVSPSLKPTTVIRTLNKKLLKESLVNQSIAILLRLICCVQQTEGEHTADGICWPSLPCKTPEIVVAL